MSRSRGRNCRELFRTDGSTHRTTRTGTNSRRYGVEQGPALGRANGHGIQRLLGNRAGTRARWAGPYPTGGGRGFIPHVIDPPEARFRVGHHRSCAADSRGSGSGRGRGRRRTASPPGPISARPICPTHHASPGIGFVARCPLGGARDSFRERRGKKRCPGKSSVKGRAQRVVAFLLSRDGPASVSAAHTRGKLAVGAAALFAVASCAGTAGALQECSWEASSITAS